MSIDKIDNTQSDHEPAEAILTPPSTSPPPDRDTRIRIKNRRKLYLDRHPEYFTSPDLELADPLLYDRCIRRFLSAAEREADGKNKGYSGVLEADLYRSEAKLAALSSVPFASSSSSDSQRPNAASSSSATYVRATNGEVLPEDPEEVPRSKEEGFERWRDVMEMRFLKGEDGEFDYGKVDGSEELDEVERREEEERWFDEETPGWVGEGGESETGIQDF